MKNSQSNFRIKILEINITPEGIFAKGIPYKDRELSEEEKKVSIKEQIEEILQLIN